jgi:hypothetical protein
VIWEKEDWCWIPRNFGHAPGDGTRGFVAKDLPTYIPLVPASTLFFGVLYVLTFPPPSRELQGRFDDHAALRVPKSPGEDDGDGGRDCSSPIHPQLTRYLPSVIVAKRKEGCAEDGLAKVTPSRSVSSVILWRSGSGGRLSAYRNKRSWETK